MAPQQAELLQDLLRRESRSLLQYVSESFPWTRGTRSLACDAVRGMAQAEAEVLGRLGRWLAKQRVAVTFPGAYPMHFTTGNFVALDYLLPRLVLDEQRLIAAAEFSQPSLAHTEAQALVQELIDLKIRHVQALNALREQTTPPAVAS